MEKNRTAIETKFAKATLLVFFLGVFLRVTLALINWEANDDHLSVIRIIADENRIPDKDEVDEAFQPQLYHTVVAAVWKTVPTQSHPMRIRIAQLVSCTAGLITLVLVMYFIMSKSELSAKVRFISFSLVALNPKLIGINAQATNDSFVILFVSLSLYFGYHFFERRQEKDFLCMMVYAILAGLSKGNGLVIFIAIVLMFGLTLFQGWSGPSMTRGQVLLYGTVFLTAYVALVPMLGPYWKHYRQYGSPFVINMRPAVFPNVFDKTFVYRFTMVGAPGVTSSMVGAPGVTSIVDSLLTFRFLDMLINPVITNDPHKYPQHRTSLWSQLYGRTHFAHFDAWPPSWQLPQGGWQWATHLVWNLGRLIFVCALFPTILLLAAMWRRIVAAILSVIRAQPSSLQLGEWLLDLSVFGYIAFIVAYSLQYRDFSVMKAIFIYPGLLGFLILFARECDRFYTWCNNNKLIRLTADLVFSLLFLLYTGDVVVLITQLGIKLFAC